MQSELAKLRAFYDTYTSDSFKEITHDIQALTASTLAVLRNTPKTQRKHVLTRANTIADKLTNVVADEVPLVASLALITAVHAYGQVIRGPKPRKGRTGAKSAVKE